MKYQNKIIFFIILFLVCFNIFCAYYNTFYNAKKYYHTAYQEIKKLNSAELSNKARQNLDMSIEKSLKLLELYPKSKYVDDALLLLGKCFYYNNNYFRARGYLNQLIKLQPQSELIPQAKLWLIKIDIDDEKYNHAELKINNFLKTNIPDNIKAEIYFLNAKLYIRNNNYQEAINYFNKSIQVNNTLRPEALYAIGLIYDSLNNYQQSTNYFKKVFKSNPGEPYMFNAQLNYGIALKKQEKIDLALQNFDELLLKDINELQKAKVHLQIAECLMLQENFQTALLEYEDIIVNYPQTEESSSAYFKLGNFFERRMNYKKSLQNYIQAEKEFPKSEYADSAKTRQNALFKLLALQKVITVSLHDTSETKQISNKIFFPEQDNNYFSPDTSTVSLVTRDKKETEVNQEHAEEKREETDDKRLQHQTDFRQSQKTNKKESKRPTEVVNPEINKLDINKLDKNLFLLGEIFMLNFNKPDSALAKYKYIIDNLPESEYTSKAYYNSAYIYNTIKNDSLKADSLYNYIIEKYPDSESAARVKMKLGKEIQKSENHIIMELHKQAEEFMLDKNNPQKACKIYKNIIKKYHNSELIPKIYYSLGWCYENKLDSLTAAYTVYDSLLSKYPDSRYSKKIQPKVQQVKKSEKEQEKTEDTETSVSADSTQKENDEISASDAAVSEKDTSNLINNDQQLLDKTDDSEENKKTNDKENKKEKTAEEKSQQNKIIPRS